jgi:glycosyltransferase involved in cell wall biosynthesis
MKVTYVIGYRHTEDRYKNLTRTLDWLMTFPDIDILIVEQDKESKFKNKWNVRHIFVENIYPYNRSWAFNIAIMNSESDAFAFGDSDLIMKNDELLESISLLSEYDVISPYKSVLDLTPEETLMSIDDMSNITRPGRGETDNQKINLCGGLVIFTRDAIMKVGGWNEDFIGWGGEDDFQTLKVDLLGLKTKEMSYRIYHLYHTREAPDMNYYQRNLMMLQQAWRASKEDVLDYVSKVKPLIGDKNKFSK